MRAKIVLFAADGLGNDEIAARLDTPRQIVSKWRKRFFEQRLRRTDRSTPGRTTPEFFPLTSWSPSRRWPANCRPRPSVPLARWHCPDLARAAVEQGIVASISGTTIWRWLSADAIKPWQHRSWIFPRDPDFETKAARVLDLYARRWDGTPLRPDEYVISADEKTSIQARIRTHHTAPAAPGSRCASSTSTTAAAPWPTWPPGTSTAPSSSAAAKPPPASTPSTGSSNRS